MGVQAQKRTTKLEFHPHWVIYSGFIHHQPGLLYEAYLGYFDRQHGCFLYFLTHISDFAAMAVESVEKVRNAMFFQVKESCIKPAAGYRSTETTTK